MTKIMLVDEVKVVNYAGGIERVMCNFANEFTKRGYDMSLVCLDIEKGLPVYSLDEKVKFINLCYLGKSYINCKYYISKIAREILRPLIKKNLLRDPKKSYFEKSFIQRLRLCIKNIQPEIIVCASGDSAYFSFEAIKGMIMPPRIIVMCHVSAQRWLENLEEHQRKAWLQADYGQVLMDSYIPIIKSIGVEKVVAIPNIVEQTVAEAKVDLNIEHKTIISVGRVEESLKRHYLLIEAFAKIADKFPDWKIEIYGEIDNKKYKKHLDNLISKFHLTGRILFCGVSRNIKEKLRKADIFAFPSSYEGFGLALTEAMSVGLPAIGYKSCSAVNELIIDGETGFLCNDGIDDFAEKLKILMEDKELRIKFGKNGMKFMKNFAPKNIWDKWEVLVKKVIAK